MFWFGLGGRIEQLERTVSGLKSDLNSKVYETRKLLDIMMHGIKAGQSWTIPTTYMDDCGNENFNYTDACIVFDDSDENGWGMQDSGKIIDCNGVKWHTKEELQSFLFSEGRLTRD